MNKCKCNLKEWTSVVNYADNDLLLVHIYHLHLYFLLIVGQHKMHGW